MMKKLLIFMLVLGMATTANAFINSDIELDVSGGMSAIAIKLPDGMSNTVDGDGGYWALVSSSTNTTPTPDSANPIGGGTITASAPDASGIMGPASDTGLGLDYGVYGFFGSYSTTWSSIAAVYADSFTGTASYASLYLIDDDFEYVTHIETVPEPATVMLLGLGGLFLRRRRK